MHHVSVRVAWKDTDWTGRVCAAPGANHSCTVLKNIKENKDPVALEEVAGQAWSEIAQEPAPSRDLPPCVNERAGFMRGKAFSQIRTHNYAWNKHGAHAHFAPTLQRMPAFSFEVTPFRWVMLHEYERYASAWGIGVDDGLEQRAQDLMPFDEDTWIQDYRNQSALLDSFFSALRPQQSLVLIYAKDIPLVEDRVPGERYLMGAGFATGVEPAVEWEYSEEGPLRSIMWERGVAHSIRDSFENGFVLPYQQLLNDPALQGVDLQPFIARTPAEHFDEFSYVSELVTADGAIAALTELGRVVELLPEVVDGPWGHVSDWIAGRLGEGWQARGPYPGMGPMLAAAGLNRGVLLARRVLDDLPDEEDPWGALEQAIGSNRDGLVGRVSRKAWQKLTANADRFRQFRVMSRFGLTVDQARALFDGLRSADVLDNPYVLYESGLSSDLALSTIDRGNFPQDSRSTQALSADPIDEPVAEPDDDRRVRAASVHLLERGAEQGHTLLDEAGLRKRLANLELTPTCDPGNAAFEIAAEEFPPLLVEVELAKDAGSGWQLDRLAAVGEAIRAEVRSRIESPSLDVTWEWGDRIDAVLPEVDEPDAPENRARAEKTDALEVIVRRRISALIGPAGTGKTSMLEALCNDPHVEAGGVLLLSPTGKATVQLAARTRKPARTLAQFLRKHDRWDYESGEYYLSPEGKRFAGAKTVVIDEASMLTEEMLAATIDALTGVDRLILCGDPRQLPPIGAGRPFADLVALLRDAPGTGGGVAELRTGRRQAEDGADPERALDDVAIASIFALDAALPGADEALARVLSGEGDGRVQIASWTDEPDLHKKLVELLGAHDADLASHSRGGISRSFGADCADGDLPRFAWGAAGSGAENWQILSPVRARPGGITGLNHLVRATWRGTDPRMALRSRKFTSPLGAGQVIFADKVMCLRNDHNRKGWDPDAREQCDGSIANGEIGMIVKAAGKPPKGHTVEFSTQPGRQYTFWAGEMNSGAEQAQEWLELAYAVTVHKSQGSQFKVTYVVIPDPCPLLSPELLYTALTRQQDKVVLLKQGDVSTLREFASPSRSDTARRLTCLFRPADPFALGDGTIVDSAYVHRTARGDDLVRSKSEVIVADALNDLRLDYQYESELRFPGEFPRRPDFTIARAGTTPVYWEHLGMLDLSGYRADWESRKKWYASHDILPWAEGGGAAGTLVWSDENVGGKGINSNAIRDLAREVFDLT
jgi:hypothetical protein